MKVVRIDERRAARPEWDRIDAPYASGLRVRNLAARLAEDLLWRGKSLTALTARERAGLLAH